MHYARTVTGCLPSATVMLHPNRNLLLSALLLLGVSASPVVSADEEAPAPARAFTQAQALQDLTAIIECRAPEVGS